MEGFTLVDGGAALVVVVSALLAYSRGLVREGMAIAGWIVAALAAFALAPVAEPLVREIPYLGDILGDSCELSVVAAFAIVFALALLVVSLFTPLLSGAIRDSALGPVDQALGFLFGVARGVLLVAVALVAYDRIAVGEEVTMVDASRTAVAMGGIAARVEAALPEDAPDWITGRYDGLVGACA